MMKLVEYEFKQLDVDIIEFLNLVKITWVKIRYVEVCQQFGLK
jgi:hypothetical protein